MISHWTPGPAAGSQGEVVVSVTDFKPDRLRDLPRIVATGLRLQMGWYAMRGAVGLRLWSLPLERRSGSISVWTRSARNSSSKWSAHAKAEGLTATSVSRLGRPPP